MIDRVVHYRKEKLRRGEDEPISAQLVERVFSVYSGLPLFVLSDQVPLSRAQAVRFFQEHIVGQDQASLLPGRAPSLREQALAGVRSGERRSDVAKRLAVSPSTVGQWCKDAGLPPGRRGDPGLPARERRQLAMAERARQALALVSAGMTPKDAAVETVRRGVSRAAVARVLGLPSVTVTAWCLRAGLRSRPPQRQFTAAQRRTVLRMITEEGLSVRAAAARGGVFHGTVLKWCRTLGAVSSHAPPPRYSKEERERLYFAARKMCQRGTSLAEISKRLGISRPLVRRFCRGLYSLVGGGTMHKATKQGVALLLQGWMPAAAARATGANWLTLRSHRRALIQKGVLKANGNA